MTSSSYQNSIPGQLSATVSAETEPTTWGVIDDHENLRSKSGRMGRFVLTMAVALLLFVAYMGLLPENGAALRGSSSNSEAALLPLADAAPADMPQPDYNGEGRYDWQKCKASNDPDCWKNEGERVGGYWHNFGLRMQTFWSNFRKSIHDFFAGTSATTNEAVEEETVETEKKHHKKKDDVDSAAVNTTVAP